MSRKLVFAASLMIIVVGMLGVASDLYVGYASPYTDVDVDTAYNMITNGSYPDLVVLDVRTQSEYDSGHIYGAVWIPHTELKARISELAGHEDHEVIVYCRSGVRSVNASETLDFFNFTKVYNMLGGILAWESGGYPVWIATVHNLNTAFSYDTIQAAIDASQTLYGHTIFVEEGTYYEHVTINKSVSLIGENRSNTIIDGKHKGDVVHISADNVVVSRFTIINSKDQGGYAGINSHNIKNCSIRENNILSNWRGIWIYNCTNNIIHGNSILNTTESLAMWVHYANNTVISSNIVTNNPSGVYLYYSDDNVVRRNSITDNNYYGLTLTESTGNLIIENVIANNSEWDGVALWDSCHNTVTANNILNNPHGVRFGFSSNNTIYHNNFINNAIQAYNTYREYDSEPSINSWDDGYPSGGNYWNDYNGTDTDHDGIGNTLYVIDLYNNDSYPLMGPFHSFNTTLGSMLTLSPTPPLKTLSISSLTAQSKCMYRT